MVMRYIIDYDTTTVRECTVVSEHKEGHEVRYRCLVDGKTVYRQCVYDSIEDAYRELDEYVQGEMESQAYEEGCSYACGYYD